MHRAFRMLIYLERKCRELDETDEQLREKQEMLASLMESKKNMQKNASEKFHEKIFKRWSC